MTGTRDPWRATDGLQEHRVRNRQSRPPFAAPASDTLEQIWLDAGDIAVVIVIIVIVIVIVIASMVDVRDYRRCQHARAPQSTNSSHAKRVVVPAVILTTYIRKFTSGLLTLSTYEAPSNPFYATGRVHPNTAD
ncbi:hypothetical protein VOLCADRAFT_104999 [Volvox carteri f. nagariensis]|uniref:Uncharacterized protein n=1 Tax=Volvox carteri f. nagariensis TaxID=3068 RepID=D8TXP7_VOLCA|nr:uncharacterized protein VOLCADRAFT_104999 [Volvox carteri f. nagariensis]EFJ47678.1 hypothetical protein VOLCADRAFT_104999 [Volvox carteri f. nagariensis]|eukprot:XP_002951149.1 hypothetical protein VOLCADRAFT_104999 [Volvox carteri f. nagariensis]